MTTRLAYVEGDAFGVPLDDGSYAVCVVARRGAGLLALGYFFAPRRDSVPTIEELGQLEPEAAFAVWRFSGLAIADGRWPRVGRVARWDRSRWPIPGSRAASSVLTGRPFRVDHADDLVTETGRRPVSPEEFESLSDDDIYGARAVEVVL